MSNIEDLKNQKRAIVNSVNYDFFEPESGKIIFFANNYLNCLDAVYNTQNEGKYILPCYDNAGGFSYWEFDTKEEAMTAKERIRKYIANLEIYRAVSMVAINQAETEEELNSIDLTYPVY